MDSSKLRELRDSDQSHLLHPFTDHGKMHAKGTYLAQSASGVRVRDEQERELIDGLAGLWCVNAGYGRKEIIEAITRQLKELAYYPSFFNTTTVPTIRLAERIAKLAPERITRVFFTNSGSEANEAGLKLIRNYWKLKGKPKRKNVATLTYAYHGVTLATTSMTRIASCVTPFDLPLNAFIEVPGPYAYASDTGMGQEEFEADCLKRTRKIIEDTGPETFAAFFAEPVQGAGGVVVPTPGYMKSLRELCREHEILFVADEVITGFGRLGAWFASELWDLDPDFISTAKGITSGYFPLGASLVCREVGDALVEGGYLAHGHTYSGHPVGCAAALANIEIIEKDKLIPYVRDEIGPYFQKKLKALGGHPAVGEARGKGLIGALELLQKDGSKKGDAKNPLGPKAVELSRKNGVIVRGIRDMVALAPPLTISKKDTDLMFEGLQKALDSLWN